MRFCKKCNSFMNEVSSFSKEGFSKFWRCPRCRSETKRQPLKESELFFGELHINTEKRKSDVPSKFGRRAGTPLRTKPKSNLG